MLANNNLKVCWTLAKRDFRFHRAKNCILALAVALVTGLYAFMFLLGGAVEDAYLLNYQYTYGSTSHILYTGLTEHQAALLSQHPNVKSAVRLSTVGTLSDPMLGQRSVKLAVTDRDYAQTVLSIPTTGRLPEQPGEIALDEFTMGSLGVLQEIGAPVTLEWTDAAGNTHTDAFALCGWWGQPHQLHRGLRLDHGGYRRQPDAGLRQRERRQSDPGRYPAPAPRPGGTGG